MGNFIMYLEELRQKAENQGSASSVLLTEVIDASFKGEFNIVVSANTITNLKSEALRDLYTVMYEPGAAAILKHIVLATPYKTTGWRYTVATDFAHYSGMVVIRFGPDGPTIYLTADGSYTFTDPDSVN